MIQGINCRSLPYPRSLHDSTRCKREERTKGKRRRKIEKEERKERRTSIKKEEGSDWG
jgi:hypothetical protein